MKEHGLLHRRRTREAEVDPTAKRYALLPSGPNELGPMDVTYVHFPGYRDGLPAGEESLTKMA